MTEETMFPTEDLILAVKKGACFLDEAVPGWAEKIDLDNLKMSSCTQCIIGQAVDGYFSGITRLTGLDALSNESSVWAGEHGFNIPESEADVDEFEGDVDWPAFSTKIFEDLESIWTEQVKERRR